MPDFSVPALRVRQLNEHSPNPDGRYVLYWMVAYRRAQSNFALQHAVTLARNLNKPLVVLEALRCDYPWANDRMHRFALQSMAANRQAFSETGVGHYAYVEPRRGDGSGLMHRISQDAAAVVTDDWPCFFIPALLRRAAAVVNVAMQAVDSNGLLPMRATDKVFSRAFDFRRFLQKNLAAHLGQLPLVNPLAAAGPGGLPPAEPFAPDMTRRWPVASDALLRATSDQLARLPIDHRVGAAAMDGGSVQAQAALQKFLATGLNRYDTERNQPDTDPSSGLSPYLHFGNISAAEVFSAIVANQTWNIETLPTSGAKGSREGWWGMSPAAEAFLDQLITWRELGFNFCWQRRDYDRYQSLPAWAKETLDEHASDPRPHDYALDQFDAAQTHDPIWNAAQRQLVREGRMHNYLRMLWGKKILHWSRSPEQALQIMIDLNNRYAVDGRDPNSYSGIFWVLGRYDRAWQQRAVFGKIRYMSSKNTRRKLALADYLKRYA